MTFDKNDAERWEQTLRALAQEAEQQGDEELAKMFYACSAFMYDTAQKLKPPPPTLLS